MNAIEAKFYNHYVDLIESEEIRRILNETDDVIAEYRFSDYSEDDDSTVCLYHIDMPKQVDILKHNCVELYLTSQKRVASYYLDFELLVYGFWGDIIKIAIEIDGHLWHEKTRDQAAKDKKREREISAYGYYVLRFTGSEVYNKPGECVKTVMDTATRLVTEKYSNCRENYIREALAFNDARNGIK